MHHTLTVTAATWIKKQTIQSTELPESEKAFIKAGVYPVRGYTQAKDHIQVTFDPERFNLKDFHESGHNTWFIYSGHIEDPAGFSPYNQPKDEPPKPEVKNLGHAFKLPGQSSTFYSNLPIIPNGNFTWGEALHFDGNGNYRRPDNARVVDGILSSAKAMQEVRDLLGVPIFINSWYRDPATNRRVGGATQSTHMAGQAVDFRVQGMHPSAVYARLNPWWGARGGLASASVFTHIDVRGFMARWSYGF